MSGAGRKSWSIRRRLTRRVLWLVLLAWLGAIALATLFLDHEINEMLDEELQAMAETTVLYIEASPGQVIPAISASIPEMASGCCGSCGRGIRCRPSPGPHLPAMVSIMRMAGGFCG
ncbi:hypothetical protein [Gemmobacter sp. 24YEA27]|uniref:hypothetical protein n=1 Tax=Gemmobacter sp. 24YEA27 TaxID=3040672 RepID=UPI0024B342B7|nr:hypothetical protein [Gemmobacter sp. 24YEA27]